MAVRDNGQAKREDETRTSPSRASRLRTLLAKLGRLRAGEWGLLIQMGGLLGLLLILQRLLSLPRLIRFFDARPVRSGDAPLPLYRVTHLTDALLRRIYEKDYCMKRAILLFHFLRKWGYPAQIHFGVAKKEGALRGHAWLELEGEPFREAGTPQEIFATTYSYPAVRTPDRGGYVLSD